MYLRLPTDIQSEAIPLILGGGDVLMAAETGSGKTGAFCLPVLQIVWETINGISPQIPTFSEKMVFFRKGLKSEEKHRK